MHLYRLAYQTAQLGIPDPDVTLILGDCRWKVHGDLLGLKSPFFEKALEGDFMEASTKEITLHDDDPFIIARIIQYLYLDEWDVSQVYEYGESREGTKVLEIEDIMEHLGGVKTYITDSNQDCDRSCLQTFVMVINTADKYLMENMINRMTCMKKWKDCIEEVGGHKFMEVLLKEVTYQRLIKYRVFKDVLAVIASHNVHLTRNKHVQEWCDADKGLGLQIAQRCADQIKVQEIIIRNLEEQLAENSPQETSEKSEKMSSKKRKIAN